MSTSSSSAAEISELAAPVVRDVVWATMATVGPDGRPRSRIVHPVLTWDDGPKGWITSRPTALRRRHLAATPWVSLSYWSPAHDCVHIDAAADWVPAEELASVWESIRSVPEPVGFDPASIWPDGPTSSSFAVIALRPHRIRVALATSMAAGAPAPLWTDPDMTATTG